MERCKQANSRSGLTITGGTEEGPRRLGNIPFPSPLLRVSVAFSMVCGPIRLRALSTFGRMFDKMKAAPAQEISASMRSPDDSPSLPVVSDDAR
jgi:hypothetical protein